MQIIIEVLVMYLIFLQVLDGYTTYTAIKTGKGKESNKLFDFFNKNGSKLGVTICIIVCIKIALVYWGLFTTIGGINLYLHAISMIALSGWYTHIICNNYKVLGSE